MYCLRFSLLKGLKSILFLFSLLISATSYAAPSTEDNTLILFVWGSSLDPALVKKFQEETGINVQLNYFDSDESIEAKLLTGESGYDIISPTLSPFYIRQMELGLYLSLCEKDIPNLKNIDPAITNILKNSGITETYGIPLSWGTVGFAYDEEKVKEILGTDDFPQESWELIFNPVYAEKLASCGIQLLDDPLEVFFSLSHAHENKYLVSNREDLDILTEHFRKIIPYIKRFDSSSDSMISTIAKREACIVHCWSGEATKVIQALKAKGENTSFKFVNPKEGFSVWLDMLVIPKNAPHPENAKKFINFMLEPQNAAQNFIYTSQPSTVVGVEAHLPEEYKQRLFSFPAEKGLQSFKVNNTLTFQQTKKITNAWLRLRLGI